MIPTGNYDSEGGGGAQMFPPAGMGSGNVQSDLAPFNEEMRFRATPDFDHYASVGFEIMRMQQQQALMAQQAAMQPMGPDGGQLALQPTLSGFDNDWLSKRLQAGSADGAKISGLSSPNSGGGVGPPSKGGGPGPEARSPYMKPNYGALPGAGRLMGG